MYKKLLEEIRDIYLVRELIKSLVVFIRIELRLSLWIIYNN